MATPTSLEKAILSGSTNGLGVKVAATTSTGTTVHTAVAGTTTFDEVTLWAVNTGSSAKKLTIEWGTTTAADGNIERTIDGEVGPVLIIPGFLLRNSLVITAFCETANVILIFGEVIRHTP